MSAASSFLANSERTDRRSPAPPPPESLQELVAELILEWRGTAPDVELRPTTREVLDQHPQLERHQSLLLDLAVEEFCLRRDRGLPVDPITFAAQFPQAGAALRSVLIFYEQNSAAFELPEPAIPRQATWPTPGQLLEGFLLLQELGRGANSRVFLAAELAVAQRLVVLKISRGVSPEPSVLGKLRHSHIVPILSVATCNGDSLTHDSVLTLIVMPFLGRTTLADLIAGTWGTGQRPTSSSVILDIAQQGALGETLTASNDHATDHPKRLDYKCAVVELVIQIADALQHAHNNGVYHCDIKPSNILLTPDGTPLIMDFNASTTDTDGAYAFAGTIAYMPPETLETLLQMPSDIPDHILQATTTNEASSKNRDKSALASNDHARYTIPWPILLGIVPKADQGDRRELSDVYSLGAVLYEALTGRLPFGLPDSKLSVRRQAAMLYNRQHKSPLTRSQTASLIDDDLFRIIDRSLSPVPSQRYCSASAFASELRDFLNLQRRRQVKSASTWRSFWATATALAFTLLLALWAAYVVLDHNRDLLDLGVLQYETGQFEESARTLTRGIEKARDRSAKLAALGLNEPSIASKSLAMHFVRSRCFVKLGKLKEAESDLEEAIAASRSPVIAVHLAHCKGQLGNDRDALACYMMAVSDVNSGQLGASEGIADRDLVILWNNLAYHAARTGNLHLSLDYLSRARQHLHDSELAERVVCNQADILLQVSQLRQVDPKNLLLLDEEILRLARKSKNSRPLFLAATRLASRRFELTQSDEDQEALVAHLLESVASGVDYKDVMRYASIRQAHQMTKPLVESTHAIEEPRESWLIAPEDDLRKCLAVMRTP